MRTKFTWKSGKYNCHRLYIDGREIATISYSNGHYHSSILNRFIEVISPDLDDAKSLTVSSLSILAKRILNAEIV